MYIATKYKITNNRSITQQLLYKLLSFYDFKHLREVGIPALNLKYLALEKGPVPQTLYDEIKSIKSTDKYTVQSATWNDQVREITPNGQPNLDLLSKYQLELLDNWLFIIEGHSTSTVREATHEQISSWRRAWNNKEANSKSAQMTYEDEFDSSESYPDAFIFYKSLNKKLI
ncbi:MAG: Panacea domain-containing protein [Methylacidiphilales bacterium]|nr:Panacea domain-containing protein [Candidatus Methylacidiphilales bacterium]